MSRIRDVLPCCGGCSKIPHGVYIHGGSTGRKGLKMIYDDSRRKHLIRELEDIRLKLSELAGSSGDAGTLQNEIAVLGWRIEQLTGELKSIDAIPDGDPVPKVILVVDDNDELRTFIRHALELSDYSVLEASDGKSALALLEKETTIDLILCDVIMPGIKGPDIVRKARDKFPGVKVIFMSGYITEGIVNQDVERSVASGDDFLTKPFPTRKMLEAVQDALED